MVWKCVFLGKNKVIVDNRLCSRCATHDVSLVGIDALAAYSHSAPLRPARDNMTSSTNPEVHNVSQRRQRRTEPQPHRQCEKMWWSSAVWFLR